MKKLNVSLNEKSFLEAARQIERYQKELDRKNELFVQKLSDIGLNVVNSIMLSVPPINRGDYVAEKVEPVITGDHVSGAAIRLSGDQILFIEFSAGITFGQTSFPSLPDGTPYGNGMGVGTYPGQKHAEDPTGWWYKDEWGHAQHTYGIRAEMPMYNADVEIVQSIGRIAKEVFG